MMVQKATADNIEWFNSQLKLLTVRLKEVKSASDYSTIEWPAVALDIQPADMIGTANFLARSYGETESECALNSLDSFLTNGITINYFFGRMHIIGHLLHDKLRPDLDKTNLQDIALIELAAVFFAVLTCRYFYGIENMSPQMARELAVSMHDFTTINSGKEIKYKGTDILDYSAELFDQLLEDLRLQIFN